MELSAYAGFIKWNELSRRVGAAMDARDMGDAFEYRIDSNDLGL
jgi:hypothetical protein